MKWNDIVQFSPAIKAVKRTLIVSRFYEELIFTKVFKLKIFGEKLSIGRLSKGRQGSRTTIEQGLH